MCFNIDIYAPKPKQRFAYKILSVRNDGTFCGEVSMYRYNYTWKLGVTRRLRQDLETSAGSLSGQRTVEGLYVSLTAKRAREHLKEHMCHSSAVLVKVRVDPADHLHSSDARGVNCIAGVVATYRAITPVKVLAYNFQVGEKFKPAVKAKLTRLLRKPQIKMPRAKKVTHV